MALDVVGFRKAGAESINKACTSFGRTRVEETNHRRRWLLRSSFGRAAEFDIGGSVRIEEESDASGVGRDLSE